MEDSNEQPTIEHRTRDSGMIMRNSADLPLSWRRLVALCGLAGVELLIAWAIVQILVQAVEKNPTGLEVGSSSPHGAHTAHPAETVIVAPPTLMIIGLVAICLTAIALIGPIRRAALAIGPSPSQENMMTVSGIFGLVILVIAFLPAVRFVASQSHVAMMAQVMIVMVAAPAVLAYAVARQVTRRPSARALWFMALPAALVYATLMVAFHLAHQPSNFALIMGFLVGFGLWMGVFTDLRASVDRVRTVAGAVMAAPGGLLGLAFLVSSQPLMSGVHNHGWLSPVTDQRLGGLLMMVVEAAFLIPILLSPNGFGLRTSGTDLPNTATATHPTEQP